ncbi:MAG: DUF6894 family protein [Allosphingosinicella sp.]
MQRYYFHVRDCWGEALDEEGLELADIAAARTIAIKGARSLICAEAEEGRLDLGGEIKVTDAAGGRFFLLRFDEAVVLAKLPRR